MVITIAPKAVQSWRELALAHPGRAIWSGFLVTSALAGSGFVLMLTIIGVVLLPAMLIVTAVANHRRLCAGILCAWRRALAGGRANDAGRDRGQVRAGLSGAFLAGLAWLVPVAGWFFVLGLTMLGNWHIGSLRSAAWHVAGGAMRPAT